MPLPSAGTSASPPSPTTTITHYYPPRPSPSSALPAPHHHHPPSTPPPHSQLYRPHAAQSTQGGVKGLGCFATKLEAAICYAKWATTHQSGVGVAALVTPKAIKKKLNSGAQKSKGSAVTKFFAARKQRTAVAGGAGVSPAETAKARTHKESKSQVPECEPADDDDGSDSDDYDDDGDDAEEMPHACGGGSAHQHCEKSTGFGIACVACHRSKYACHGFPCSRCVRFGSACVPQGGVSVAAAAAAATAQAAAAAKLLSKSRPHRRNPSAGPPVEQWGKGSTLEALDGPGTWYEASVMDERGHGDARELLVHYKGWKARYDEWLGVGSGRLRANSGAQASGTSAAPRQRRRSYQKHAAKQGGGLPQSSISSLKRTKHAGPACRSRTSHAMAKAVREQLSAVTKAVMMEELAEEEAEEEELAANTLMAASAVCKLPSSTYSDAANLVIAAPLQWQRTRPAPLAQGCMEAVAAVVAAAQPSHAAVEGLLSLLSPRKLAPRIGAPPAAPPFSSPVGFALQRAETLITTQPQGTTASCRSSSMIGANMMSDPTAKHIVFAFDLSDQSPAPSCVLPLLQPARPLASQQPLGLWSAPAMEGALPSLSVMPPDADDGSASGLCYPSALAASQTPLADRPAMRPKPSLSALPPYLCLPTALPKSTDLPPYPPLRWRPALAGAPPPHGSATLAASSVASMAVAVGKAALGAAVEAAETSFNSSAAAVAAAATTTPRLRWRGVVTLPAGAASSPIAPPSKLLARTLQAARGPAPPPNFASAKIASAQLQAQLHAQLQAPSSPVKTDAPPDGRVAYGQENN